MAHRVAVIAGDGAGPEVVAEARKAVDALGLDLTWHELPWGTDHFHEHGTMMPADALDVVRGFDAVLLGAVGDPSVPDHVTLWGLLLPLRQGLDLWANVRPARLLDGIPSKLEGRPAGRHALRAREHRGRVLGRRRPRAPGARARGRASRPRVFTRAGVRRVVEYAFELAEQRRGVVTSATKSNASPLRLRALGRGRRGGRRRAPGRDARARARRRARRAHGEQARRAWTSSSRRTSSATSSPTSPRCCRAAWAWPRARSLAPGSGTTPVFEPVHGSAPDIAGQGIANPMGAIWSAALMLETLGEAEAAARLMRALEDVCRDGPRTRRRRRQRQRRPRSATRSRSARVADVVVARRRLLRDLRPQLRRLERRRRRRPARDPARLDVPARPRRRRDLADAVLPLPGRRPRLRRRRTTSTSTRSSARSPTSTRWSRARTSSGCA